MSYRKQRALRRILSGRQKVALRRSQHIEFSEMSLQKAKDYSKEHIPLKRLPIHDRVAVKSKEQQEFIRFQQEVRLAKLLERKLPDNPSGDILKLPIPEVLIPEEDD